jgi:DNA replication protein DnaC
VPELLERIRNTFNRNERESEKDIMNALLHCDLLVLDDVGSEKVSDWVLDVLFRMVDGRYRQKKPILYTTNLNPKELKHQLNERIYDRMVETSVIIENRGTSFRREIAQARYDRMREGDTHG